MNSPAPSPCSLLRGIRVVELGGSVAGPYGTWILGSLGATVLKFERPGSGDDCRAWVTARHNGLGSIFAALNSGKHSIEVDLRDEQQLAAVRDYIVNHADVVLQNLRPGYVQSIGLGAEELLALNPRLVYCNSGAFGREGPLAGHPGYDPLMQAFGGIMSVTGVKDGPPVRVGTSIVDMGDGMWCAIGILAALGQRERTGKGAQVDASLFETALGWMTYHFSAYFGAGKVAGRRGTAGSGIAPYQAYPCLDGQLVIAAGNDRLFVKLAGAIGEPQWSEDPRFVDNPARLLNNEALNDLIATVTIAKPRAHWREVLQRAGVPNAPLQDVAEVANDAQTKAVGIIQETSDGAFKLVGLPLSFNGTRPPLQGPPPQLGEHTQAFFAGRFDRAEAGRHGALHEDALEQTSE